MEFIIKCPDCGKELKIKVEEAAVTASKATLTTRKQKTVSWYDVADRIRSDSSDGIDLGDEISCTLKDGTEVVFVAAAINPYAENEVAFVLKDCLPDTHVMNEEWTNEGGWRDSSMRKYLNEEIVELLPDDLKAVIKERTITQNKNGTTLTSTDKLWLPSRTEVTGKAYDTDVDDVHFPIFKDERGRVKQIGSETEWYWLRSPYASYGTTFCVVYTNGGAGYGSANDSNGVAFGFLI